MSLSKEEYIFALKGERRFTDRQLDLIRYWHSAPKAKITAKQIANEFDYSDGNRSNLDIGNIAKIVLSNLGKPENGYRDRDQSWLWDAICDDYSKGWIMARSFMEALEESGIVSKDDRYWERPPMRQDLPELDKDLLNLISKSVFSLYVDVDKTKNEDERLTALIKVLLDMQTYNYKYRFNDRLRLFPELDQIFKFDYNTEGTALWLALILAIQELYGLSDSKILKLMKEMLADT